MAKLEKYIEAYLARQVVNLGGKSFKWVSPSNRGVCDRIVFVKNQVWFVELKRSPQHSLSPLQERFKQLILQYTLNYAVLSSKQEVDEWIKSL